MAQICSTEMSGNFVLIPNGSVQSNQKVSKKSAHFSRWTTFLGWTRSQSQYLTVKYNHFLGETWWKAYLCSFWIVNMGCIAVLPVCYIHLQLELHQVCSCFLSQYYVLAVKNDFFSTENLEYHFHHLKEVLMNTQNSPLQWRI